MLTFATHSPYFQRLRTGLVFYAHQRPMPEQHAELLALDARGDQERASSGVKADTKSAQDPVAQDAPIHSRAATEQPFGDHYNRHQFFRTKPGQKWRKRAVRPGLASLHSRPLARH